MSQVIHRLSVSPPGPPLLRPRMPAPKPAPSRPRGPHDDDLDTSSSTLNPGGGGVSPMLAEREGVTALILLRHGRSTSVPVRCSLSALQWSTICPRPAGNQGALAAYAECRLTSAVQLRAGRADHPPQGRDRGGPAEGGTRRAQGNQAPRAPTVSCNGSLASRSKSQAVPAATVCGPNLLHRATRTRIDSFSD